MGNRIMDHMPSLLLPMAVTPRQHLLQEATPSSNSSMGPPMANQHQVSVVIKMVHLTHFDVVLLETRCEVGHKVVFLLK